LGRPRRSENLEKKKKTNGGGGNKIDPSKSYEFKAKRNEMTKGKKKGLEAFKLPKGTSEAAIWLG